MLSKVSWSQYIVLMGLLVASYYFYIGVKYYRQEISLLLNRKLQRKNNTVVPVQGKNYFKDQAISQAAFDELEAVINDLRYAVFDKSGRQVSKQELMTLLQQRLGSYQGLFRADFRLAINNNIITNAKEICGVIFDADELNRAWSELPH